MVEKVRVSEKSTIPARSEQVVFVRCKNKCYLVNADFEPRKLSGRQGLFVSKARVLPNINDIFQITVLNVTESDVTISNRTVIGDLHKADETNFHHETSPESQHVREIIFGNNLNRNQTEIIDNRNW